MINRFQRLLRERSGVPLELCFQCLCCATGCPVVEIMDRRPNQLIRMIQRGMEKEVLESKTIWVCVGCFNCVDQCPNRIHIPLLMDSLRQVALEKGVKPAEPEVFAFYRQFLKEVSSRGRINEMALMMRYKLSTGSLFQDFIPGLKMLIKGKLPFWTPPPRKLQELKRVLGGQG